MFLAREFETAASRVVLDAPIALDTHEPQGLRDAFFVERPENELTDSLANSRRDRRKPENGISAALAFKGLDVGAKVSIFMLFSSWPPGGHSMAVYWRLPGAGVVLAPLTFMYWRGPHLF